MSEDIQKISSRVDAFARELAIALRRITGRTAESVSKNLPEPVKEKQKQLIEKSNN